MSKTETGSKAKKFPVLDAVLVVGFFLISFLVLRPSVPVYTPLWVNFWSILGGLCMTGVFWLAMQMFKVVLFDQIEMNKGRPPEA